MGRGEARLGGAGRGLFLFGGRIEMTWVLIIVLIFSKDATEIEKTSKVQAINGYPSEQQCLETGEYHRKYLVPKNSSGTYFCLKE